MEVKQQKIMNIFLPTFSYQSQAWFLTSSHKTELKTGGMNYLMKAMVLPDYTDYKIIASEIEQILHHAYGTSKNSNYNGLYILWKWNTVNFLQQHII